MSYLLDEVEEIHSILFWDFIGDFRVFCFLALLGTEILESMCDTGAKTCNFGVIRPADFFEDFTLVLVLLGTKALY